MSTLSYANYPQCVALLFQKSGDPDTLSGVTPLDSRGRLMHDAKEHAAPGES
jgi:hypothetical protein